MNGTAEGPPDERGPDYVHDAFVSYSRTDAAFARKLTRALDRYRPPRGLDLPSRTLSVFRDEGDLTGSEYYESIDRHLGESKTLIVICSPAARKSRYVNDEIRRFAATHELDAIVPVLLDGIPNNEVGPGQEDSKAFPEALCELMEMPLAASFLDFDEQRDRPDRGRFQAAWYTVLANVCRVSRRAIEQRDVRRRRRLQATAAGTVLGVMGVLVTLTTYAVIQRSLADERRGQAETAAAKAEAINSFMQETLLSPDPVSGQGRDVTIAAVLATTAARIDSELGATPEVAATVRAAIGWAYHRLGRYEEAEPLLFDALREREAALPPDHPEVAEGLFMWAEQLAVTGNYEEAERTHVRALTIRRALPDADLVVAESLTALGIVVGEIGRLDEAEAYLREALAIAQAVSPEGSDVATITNQLGVALWNKGELDEIEALWQHSLDLRRAQVGTEHPLVAEMLNNLAVLYDNTDRVVEAEALYREALELQRRLLGPEHEEVTAVMANLAILLDNAGKWDEAEVLYRDVTRIDQARLGADHLFVGYDLAGLGAFLCNVDKASEGLEALRSALPIHEANLEPGHWRIGNVRQWTGFCLTHLGRFAEAEIELQAGLSILIGALGEDHFRVDAAREKLVSLYEAWDRPERAAEHRALLQRTGG